jgi:uncharacterized membrane protein
MKNRFRINSLLIWICGLVVVCVLFYGTLSLVVHAPSKMEVEIQLSKNTRLRVAKEETKLLNATVPQQIPSRVP